MDVSVILTESDPKLGKRGQVIQVSSGYAQNFLFPHQKAKPATPENLKALEREKIKAAKEEEDRLSIARSEESRISALRLRVGVSAGEGDKLFGSVTSQDLAQALEKEGIALDRKKIHLEEPLKKLGAYKIPVKLHHDVIATLHLELVKK